MSCVIGDRYEQVRRSPFLSRVFRKSGGPSTEPRRNIGDQLIVVSIFLLKNAYKPLAAGHINALELGVVIEIVRISHAR